MEKIIIADSKRMEDVAGRIEVLSDEYKAQYDLMYMETDTMASNWGGADSKAFRDQIDGFRDDFKKMHGLMNDYASFLRTAAKAYRKAQEDTIAEARKLQN